MKSSTIIPLAIVSAGVILAGAVYVSLKAPDGVAQVGAALSALRPVGLYDHIAGSPTAKVTIIEYSDFDCSHCKIFNETLHQIVNDYGATGEVAWVFRNFALTEINPNAKKHAEAAECVAQAAGNDAYFKFNELLFAHQPANPLQYAEYARASGASPDQVASCIHDAATNGIDANIDADRENALAIGAHGTPYSLIMVSGKTPIIIDSAWPYADLKDQIEMALQ